MDEPSSPEFPERRGISLDELTEAYAQAMRGDASVAPEDFEAEPPDEAATDAEVRGTIPIGEAELAETDDEAGDGVIVSPVSVVETLLFVGSIDNQALSAAAAAELMRGVAPAEVTELVDALNARYRSNGCPYEIVGNESGYRMVLRQAFAQVRDKFYGKVREAKLSQASIDTLAIVAYRQPLTSEQVSQLRGTPSGHLLTQLVRRQLLTTEREKSSRQVLYRTTDRFLELFGLESLEELPDSE